MFSIPHRQQFLPSFCGNRGLERLSETLSSPVALWIPAQWACPARYLALPPRTNFLSLLMLLRFKLNKSAAVFSRFRYCKISLAFNVVGCLSVFLCLARGLNKSYKQY